MPIAYYAGVSLWNAVPAAPAARRAERLDFAASGIALALVLLVIVDFSPVLRFLLALLFTFFVPGRAIVTNWFRLERWSGIGMSMLFSLGLITLLATVSVWIGFWHPLGLFVVVAVISLAGLANGIVTRRQHEDASRRLREQRERQRVQERERQREQRPPDRPQRPQPPQQPQRPQWQQQRGHQPPVDGPRTW